jgi:hypothetical protein
VTEETKVDTKLEARIEEPKETRVHKVDGIPESFYWNTYAIGGFVALLGCILVVIKRGK